MEYAAKAEVIKGYLQLWNPDGRASLNSFAGWLLLLFVTVFPLTVGLLFYDPKPLLIGLTLIGMVVGSIYFANIRLFLIWVVPFAYLIIRDMSVSILVILSFIAFIVNRISTGKLTIQVPYPVTMAILILFGMYGGLVLAVDSSLGRYAMLHSLFFPMILFIVFYNVKPTIGEIRNFILVACLFTAILSWGTLAQYLLGGDARTVFGWSTVNRMAGFLSLVIPYSMLMVLKTTNIKWRLAWIWIFLGLCSGLLVTQTRAIMLSSFIVMFYLGIKDRRAWQVMSLLVVVAVIFARELFLSRLAMTVGMGEVPDWSSIGRLEIWLNSLQMLPDYYLFGMGIESFRFIYPVTFPNAFLKPEHAHNIYLRWLFEYGLFGTLAYGAILIRTTLKGHFAVMKDRVKGMFEDEAIVLTGINAGIISLLLGGMVDTYIAVPTTATLVWIYVAFQLNISRKMSSAGQ